MASWAEICLGNNVTGGKQRSGTTRHGNRWLAEILHDCASAARNIKNTYFAAQFWRVRRRMGHRIAAVAVGHSILVICWHRLTKALGVPTTRHCRPPSKTWNLVFSASHRVR
jgi:hypothetical protein